MTTIRNTDCDLLSLPFNAATDFFVLADYCDLFAQDLIESHEPLYKMALLGRISTCLALLRPMIGQPIPAHLVARFTAEKLPDPPMNFEPDSEALCEYCQSLTQVLSQQSLLPETEMSLKGLLCELVWMFAADLKAPQWVTAKLV
ncbi:MAG: hypothetical protein ACRCWW_07485 [Scandinavium sp.]|uniref:hypothetical protein n=1 Tax=Scandinavium sp. TaxID=2830653 RepID=UPI003F415E31